MAVRIRQAQLEDAPALLEIKHALRLRAAEPQRGGFLLGTTLEGYRQFIAQDTVLIAERAAQSMGFGILLGQESLMQSDLWARAAQAELAMPVQAVLAAGRVAYIEQLAVLPDLASRVYAKYLAFQLLRLAFKEHATVFTTVVREPVANMAVLPFLEVAGFVLVGRIEEEYPQVGRVLSDIYALRQDEFRARLARTDFQVFVRKG